MDIEQGLEPISEVEEAQLETDNQQDFNYSSDTSHLSLNHAPTSSRSFSLGTLLGSTYNFGARMTHGAVVTALRMLAIFTLLVGRILGTIVDLIFRRPARMFSRSRGSLLHVGKYLAVVLAIYLAWSALQHPSIRNISIPFPSSRPVTNWQPSDIPSENLDQVMVRLLRIENALADMRSDVKSSEDRETRKHRDTASRITKLEGQMDKESLRAMRAEEEYRQAASKNADALRKEMKALERQIEDLGRNSGAPVAVEGLDDLKAHVRLLGERLAGAEDSVREAHDANKKLQSQVGSAKADAGAPAWWNRLSSSVGTGSGLVIKSSDGQDVTAVIGHLVDDALARHVKDDLARADYALASGGATVIPSLTSAPMNMRSSGGGMLTSLFGEKATPGMSPVVALHHETHLGYCWPFEGSVGQLGVRLSRRVFPSEVTIDHVPRELAVDIGSAPREMEVWGLIEGKDNIARYKEWVAGREQAAEGDEEGSQREEIPEQPRSLPRNTQYMRLGSFVYDVDAPKHIQTFPLSEEVKALGIDFGVVVLMVKSNWGQDEFTCLYRFRLHGEQFRQAPPPSPEQEQAAQQQSEQPAPEEL